jgi:hypothetical protein
MTNSEKQAINQLLKFEYSILSEYYLPKSKNKTQIRISKRMDEILKMVKG